MFELLGVQEIIAKLVAEVKSYLSEGAFSTCEDLEMFVADSPFGIALPFGIFLIISEKILLLLAMSMKPTAVSPVPDANSAEVPLSSA